MEKTPKLFALQPLTEEVNILVPIFDREDTKLQLDTARVDAGVVDLSTFSPEYQERIKTNYRFYGHRYTSDMPYCAPRTNDTMDVI